MTLTVFCLQFHTKHREEEITPIWITIVPIRTEPRTKKGATSTPRTTVHRAYATSGTSTRTELTSTVIQADC